MNGLQYFSLTLMGYRELKIAENIKERIDDAVEEEGEALGLSLMDRTQLAASFQTKATDELKYTPIKQEVTHLCIRTCTTTDEQEPFIFERDRKGYDGEEDVLAFQPRISLVRKVAACQAIFSLSIVPMDQDKEQTLFYKRSRKQPEPIDKAAIEELFHIKLEDLVVADPNAGPSSSFEEKIKESNGPLNPENPSEIVKGFFKPFSAFSSDLAQAEHDPSQPPRFARVAKVGTQEVDQAMATIRDQNLQVTLREIVELFLDDTEAKSIALTVMQQPRPELLFFVKTL